MAASSAGEPSPEVEAKAPPMQPEQWQAYVDALIADDKLFQAERAMQELDDALSNDPRHADRLKQLRESEQRVSLKRRCEDLRALLALFEDDTRWTVVRDSEGITTSYRAEPDKGTHSFQVQGRIDVPLQNLVACLYEVDLFHMWFPLLKESEELKLVSRFRKIVRIEVSTPWPLQNRESVADCYGVDMLEENKIVIFVRSVDAFPGVAIPDNSDRVVRTVIHIGGFLVTMISPTACHFRMMINVDPKLPVLPYAVLNWFTGKVLHYIIKQLRRAALFDAESPYAARMRANRAVYGYVEQTLRDHFERDAAEAGS